MSFQNTLTTIIDLGRNPHSDPGKKRLYRAANLFTLNAMFWMVVVVVWDLSRHAQDNSIGPLVIPFVAAFQLFVLWLNKKGKTFLALSLLNFSATSMMVFFAIRAGEGAGIHVHLISVLFCTGVMFPNREARTYFFLNIGFVILSAISILWGFLNIEPQYIQAPEELEITRRVHFFIVVFVTALSASVVLIVFNRQQSDLRKALEEKETLLSEVFHRVKNNMAVILGLISLKKNQSRSEEAIEALMQCHMRVMSMSMVHNRIYETKSLNNIHLNEYLDELAREIIHSLNAGESIHLHTHLNEITCDISKAIPIGLIVNEVVTNSFKHAGIRNQNKLQIEILLLNTKEGKAKLLIRDNGSGISEPEKINSSEDSLGMTLIHSLCEQIDGECKFYNDKGAVFEMQFPSK